jgi:hypothetical protein
MRRILSVAGASLVLHTLVFILFGRYRDLTFNLGARIAHGNDIADIPRLVGVGFGVLAIIVIVAGVLFDRLVQLLRQDSE